MTDTELMQHEMDRVQILLAEPDNEKPDACPCSRRRSIRQGEVPPLTIYRRGALRPLQPIVSGPACGGRFLHRQIQGGFRPWLNEHRIT